MNPSGMNGTTALSEQLALGRILRDLDLAAFRRAVEAPPETTDEEILEAMHMTRADSDILDRELRANSRRWLELNT